MTTVPIDISIYCFNTYKSRLMYFCNRNTGVYHSMLFVLSSKTDTSFYNKDGKSLFEFKYRPKCANQ